MKGTVKISKLDAWVNYGEEMEVGNRHEVYYWENPISPGDTVDLCLFLHKTDVDAFSLSLEIPRILGSLEDTEMERDEDPDFFPDEIDGEPVKRSLGEYYIGYDFYPYPDPNKNNEITFSKFSDPKINLWLKKNNAHFLLEQIEPGQVTIDTW